MERRKGPVFKVSGEDMALTARTPVQEQKQPQKHSKERLSCSVMNERVVRDGRPTGVPRLNLSNVIGNDDNGADYTVAMDSPLVAAACGLSSAHNSARNQQSSRGIVSSRGNNRQAQQPNVVAPLFNKQAEAGSNCQPSSRKPKQPDAWDRQPVPENVPPPSQRHREQYRQIQQDAMQSCRHKTAAVTEDAVQREMDQLRINIPSTDRPEPPAEPQPDDPQNESQAQWTHVRYSKEAWHKLKDKESLEEEKRKSKMLETVLVDQLCRPVMSDPGQVISARQPQTYRPGMKRGTIRTLHDSRVRTDGSATENLLSQRVRFEARILTTNGRDAVRELTGFFFVADNTLTVYEFRQFGKSSKAMPFIKRGVYRRLRFCSETAPQHYILADIAAGNTLYFETADQPLPDVTKSKPVMALRIYDVDNEARKSILLSTVPANEKEEMWRRMHLPATPEELQMKMLMHDIHEIIRQQIAKRSIRVFTGIGRLLRQGDLSGDGLINKFELEKSLTDFHISVPQDKFDDLWDLLDPESTSFIPYDEFMRCCLGEMNEYRKFLVIKGFIKLDPGKCGVISFDNIRKFYNAHTHPKVRSGECSEEEVLQMFLQSFASRAINAEVTYREFEEYYEGLSVSMDSDGDFCSVLRNAWSI